MFAFLQNSYNTKYSKKVINVTAIHFDIALRGMEMRQEVL